MLSCQEVSRLVSQSMDGRLTWWQRLRFGLHLLMCSVCNRFRSQSTFLRAAAHEYSLRTETPTAPALSDEARERLKRALESGS